MATSLLSDSLPWPLTARDITQLAGLIQTTLMHFKTYHSSYEENYVAQIHIIYHCYFMVLLELNEQPCYCASLQHFQPFLELENLHAFSFRLAQMINTVSDKTRLIQSPWFYPHFLNAVKHILSMRVSYLINDLNTIQQLLHKIVPQQAGRLT